LEQVKPIKIYNLGAQSHVRVSFDSPEYTVDSVAMGTLRLLEAIRDYRHRTGIDTKLRSNVVDLQEYVAFEKSALPQKDSQSPEAERPLKGG
jgi:GDP-D-mannose dehydratase